MKAVNNDIIVLGQSQYSDIIGYDDMEKDDDGFLRLIPTSDKVDKDVATLTTDISSLEAKLKEFRAKKEKAEKYQKSDEYKEDKKLKSKKKKKKEKETLLSMVFNNADHADDEADIDEDDEANYRDKKKPAAKKSKETTLDSTYGKRFSPVVSMLYDTIAEFDQIAHEIELELESGRGTAKSMYRSSQIGNIISAKNSKLSAVKELASVAKTVSDLEYKKDKDKKAEEGSDSTKAISNLGAKFLRGAFELEDDKDSKKGKKKDKGKSDLNMSSKKSKSRVIDDDDDDEEDSIKKAERKRDEQELAGEFAKAILKNKDSIKFTAHEKYMNMEGKYTFVIGCDPLDPENTYKFIAIDPKSGKEIKDFKDDYKELMPKKKLVRLKFDINKKKAYDANSGRSYKLVFFN